MKASHTLGSCCPVLFLWGLIHGVSLGEEGTFEFPEHLTELPETVTKIAFGSCADQKQQHPIWEPIVAEKPDLFLFI